MSFLHACDISALGELCVLQTRDDITLQFIPSFEFREKFTLVSGKMEILRYQCIIGKNKYLLKIITLILKIHPV